MRYSILAFILALTHVTLGQSFGEKLQNPALARVFYSSIAFADVDGDNDQDLVITGAVNTLNNPVTILYSNDGLGNFTEVQGTPFVAIERGSIAFSDVDGDSDQDLLITGKSIFRISLQECSRKQNSICGKQS